ncbi:Bug family tripartite tricarboxylate transporter substrate binding protein [Azohydromonas lata]|uniref:Tripartite tricarboxylate transporter substrate binding protein n=1 Tax=Azohydromonas lata TaxID=45677 RepID=A0ABU5INR4_9BURK|nr:tripartite tricarboxylate transporter substrate binding protein [Azohydromonas lata]MDZ5460541.1 tripartite tricarboxylate transporter substrate binding protein [Azohydromonas lata]
MNSNQRTALTLALLSVLAAPVIAADKYPTKSVTVLVPQAAGGANDAIARIVAQKLSETTGQQFIVDNRPGAGGNIGTASVARSKPDGYTLLLTADSTYVINPSLYKQPGFNPLKDFESIATVATSGYVLVANNQFAPKTVSDLIAAAKAQPGKIAIASAGNGTINHLFGEMLSKAAGIEMMHVPYKGASAAVTDLVGGQVQVSVQSLPSSLPFIKGGKLKVLGVVNEKRISALPDVPTVGETVKGLGYTPWYGLFAPAGTPKAIIAQLQTDVARVLDSADVREKLASVGAEPYKTSPEQFGSMIKSELPRWAQIVKDANVTLD